MFSIWKLWWGRMGAVPGVVVPVAGFMPAASIIEVTLPNRGTILDE